MTELTRVQHFETGTGNDDLCAAFHALCAAEGGKTDATMTRHENRPWVIASVWKGAVGTLQTEQGLMVRREVSNGQKTPSD